MIKAAQNVDFDRAVRDAPGVIAALKRYDDRLRIYFDKKIQRFCVAREGEVAWHFIAVWAGPKGEFVPLDNRIIEAIASWDMRPPTLEAPKDATELSNRMDAEDSARAIKIEQNFNDDIAHLTRANRKQLEKATEEAQ